MTAPDPALDGRDVDTALDAHDADTQTLTAPDGRADDINWVLAGPTADLDERYADAAAEAALADRAHTGEGPELWVQAAELHAQLQDAEERDLAALPALPAPGAASRDAFEPQRDELGLTR